MQSTIKKRSIAFEGRKTRMSLEDEFWDALIDIAKSRKMKTSHLLEAIAKERNQAPNLSSAVRVFLLRYYRGTPQVAAPLRFGSHDALTV